MKNNKEGTCKVLGRSVVFSAFYADFCFCSKLVIITTLSSRSHPRHLVGTYYILIFIALICVHHTLLFSTQLIFQNPLYATKTCIACAQLCISSFACKLLCISCIHLISTLSDLRVRHPTDCAKRPGSSLSKFLNVFNCSIFKCPNVLTELRGKNNLSVLKHKVLV